MPLYIKYEILYMLEKILIFSLACHYTQKDTMLASLMSQKSKISDDAQKSEGFLTFHNNPQPDNV